MLSDVNVFYTCFPLRSTLEGRVAEGTHFENLTFLAGGSPKKYTNAELKKNEETSDEHGKHNDKSNNHVGKTVPYEESSDDRKHNCHRGN